MRALLAALALLLTLVTPAHAFTQPEAQQLARELGAGEDLEIQVELGDEFVAFFAVVFGVVPVIVLQLPADLPDEAARLIFLHELAHYFQMLEGRMSGPGIEFERDADVTALNWHCSLGGDARAMDLVFDYLHATHGHVSPGDPEHDSGPIRVAHATSRATACISREPQA